MRSIILVLVSTCCITGCGVIGDPFERPGTWTIGHDNEANLQAMIVQPTDLQHGHGDGVTLGQPAVTAVQRLLRGKVRPLPDSGVAEVVTTSTGSSSSGGTQ